MNIINKCLLIACSFGKFEIVKTLIENYNADFNYINENGDNLLSISTNRSHINIVIYLYSIVIIVFMNSFIILSTKF